MGKQRVGLGNNSYFRGEKAKIFMDTLGIIFLITGIVGAALVAWSYTKAGKKWLDNL